MTEAASATSEDAPQAIDRDPTLAIFLRRLVTIPATITAAFLGVLAAPLWIPIAALIDGIRSEKTAAVRCGAWAEQSPMASTACLLCPRAACTWARRQGAAAGSVSRLFNC